MLRTHRLALSLALVSPLALLSPIAVAAAGKSVPYTIDGKPYEGYYSSPSTNAPLVLIIHDWDGLGDYEKRRASMLNEMGYAVFAADLFGAGIRPESIDERKQRTGELYADRARMRALMQGALTAAQAEGARVDNAVVAGYCFGGAAALELARSGADLKGFVSFHGGLTTPEGQDYSQVKAPVLVLHGTADTAVTMSEFAALAEAMEKAGVKHEMITYSGAPHAFTVFDTDRYREEADRESWQRFGEFLGQVTR